MFPSLAQSVVLLERIITLDGRFGEPDATFSEG